jgi:hypothetical protein
MLSPYFRDADTVTLSNRINLKLNISDTSAFARDNQISGTSGQVAYFNSSNSVISDAGLIYNATNKSLGINTTTTSGANLIIKNSQEPSRDTVVATQTFAADTTNWTRGAGWAFNGTQAVATAATGNLTYTPSLTITSGNAYEITYTVTGYSAGTLTVALGNVSLALPTHNATANVILLTPTSATGGFRFTTSTFTGNVDNVSIVEISNVAPIIFAGQDDGSTTLYNSLRMPNSTSLMYGGGGRYTTGTNNVANGTNTLQSNTTGFNNLANGTSALQSNTTGTNNVANGTNTLQSNTTGSSNVANGTNALRSNTTGSSNTGIGQDALRNNTTGFNNVANGTSALQSNTTGTNNVANGTNTLRSNTTGGSNIAIGTNTLLSNTTANNNTGIGADALLSNTTGSSNIANGTSALQSNTTGATNIAIGTNALRFNTTSSNNTAIGSSALQSNTTGATNTAIGASALRSNTTGGNNTAIGNSSMYNTTVGDTLTGSNNIAIGANTIDNIRFEASGNVAIGNQVDLPTNNGSNQGVYQNVLFFTGASGTGTTIAAASKAGIKTATPNRDLEVAGEVRITDLTTDAPTRLVGADTDGDLGQVTLGAGLNLTSSSLLADTNFLVTRFDTTSMLTNYLRTGVAASTYLTQSNAALTYLPLTGGTLTGALSGTTGTFNTRLGVGSIENPSVTSLFTSGSGDQEVHFTHSDNFPGRKVSLRLTNNNSGFYTYGGLIYALQGEGLNQYTRMTLGVNTNEIMHLTRFSRVGILNDAPSYTLDVNGTFNATGNSLIGGTLGVTGATTLSAPLTVNSSAVFNEGSTDSDFRVESDGNANMVFVDASTDRVGIGYASPTKTLDVNGEVRINTLTATPTSLLGKDGSNVVGEVTTVAQTGLMKSGGTTANTSSVGIITVAHGLSYTPSQVIATISQQNSYVIVCHSKDATNLSFTVYDSVTGNPLNNVSVGFFWLAIK